MPKAREVSRSRFCHVSGVAFRIPAAPPPPPSGSQRSSVTGQILCHATERKATSYANTDFVVSGWTFYFCFTLYFTHVGGIAIAISVPCFFSLTLVGDHGKLLLVVGIFLGETLWQLFFFLI